MTEHSDIRFFPERAVIQPAWFLVFFFLSGFCSLVYEIVWLRLAMGAFGVTAPFVSLFLSVFMAGLGLGSWAAGFLSEKLKSRPPSTMLRLYALAELMIAASALAVPALLALGKKLLTFPWGGLAWDSSGYFWASGICTILALLPWCLCMGATFPLAMSAIRKLCPAQARSSFSYLYLANLIGAGSGALASAFILIETFGFKETLVLTSVLNVLVAMLALVISRNRLSFTAADHEERGDSASAAAEPSAPAEVLPLLFTTGLVSMAMEVVWLRQFTPYIGNSIYAFAVILALYLGASFAGSCLYRARLRTGVPSGDFAWIISGVLGLLPLSAANPYVPINGWVRVAIGIVPFCLVTGFMTPSLVDKWSSGNPRRAGSAYAVNVLGCILGPLVSGFVLLPWMTERSALVVLTVPLFVAGFLSVRRLKRGGERIGGRFDPVGLYALLAGSAAALILLSCPFEGRIVAELGHFAPIEVRRDYQADVVAGGEGMGKILLVNGVGMTQLTPITKMMAHLPMAFLPRPPHSALVICFGMGTTFRSLLSWGISATAVELVPSVPRFFHRFHADAAQLMALPNARVVIDDGRRFLARTVEIFDVITIDPAPPMEAAGTSFLFSTEFYSLVKDRLADDGIMQQWILEPMEPVVISALFHAIKESFPHVRVFRSVEGWGYHCLASRRPIVLRDGQALAARLPPQAVQDLLEYGPHTKAAQQFQAVIGAEVAIESLIMPDSRPLQDDRPINEYYFLRRTFPGHRRQAGGSP